ncbi:2-oxoacid:acceptor oxidoreductase family protein [Candidatus Gracilibacteria bacterium]|nr:2-oxoacid:acceptor oxidoreductase family protein [Candidatus Gracilibacteria bacterium]
MNLTIKVTGPAGLGMNSTADIISEIFAKQGYNVIGDIEYQSLIKGGINWFDINISDNDTSIYKMVDVILTFNDKNLEKTLALLKKGGYIISNKKWIEKLTAKNPDIFADYNILELEIADKYDNTYLLGMLAKLLELNLDLINKEIEIVFGRKGEDIVQKNKDIVENIYNTFVLPKCVGDYGGNFKIASGSIGDTQTISYGNKMIADGAIASDLEYYSAYPMTPASTVLTEVINAKSVPYLQAEDEIAVINSALGASYAGKRAMVGTSGGGFALMTEALSFAVQAEIPVTAILSQRAGPSTGTPTFTENGDLPFALNCIFGTDSHHVVLSPSSLEEAYSFGGLALNIADQYQCPVILLTDKQFSEGKVTLDSLQATPVNRGKIETSPAADYKRYAYNQDNISPRTYPGIKDGDFIATSYEHDEFGATSEDSEVKMRMTEKRAHKLDNFFETQGVHGYEIVNPDAKKMLVVTSFNTYTARDFIKKNPEYGLVIMKFMKPLDERLIKDLAGKTELTFVENSYSGQLENHLVKELRLDLIDGIKISSFRKYDLYPFYMEDFEERFN